MSNVTTPQTSISSPRTKRRRAPKTARPVPEGIKLLRRANRLVKYSGPEVMDDFHFRLRLKEPDIFDEGKTLTAFLQKENQELDEGFVVPKAPDVENSTTQVRLALCGSLMETALACNNRGNTTCARWIIETFDTLFIEGDMDIENFEAAIDSLLKIADEGMTACKWQTTPHVNAVEYGWARIAQSFRGEKYPNSNAPIRIPAKVKEILAQADTSWMSHFQDMRKDNKPISGDMVPINFSQGEIMVRLLAVMQTAPVNPVHYPETIQARIELLQLMSTSPAVSQFILWFVPFVERMQSCVSHPDEALKLVAQFLSSR